MSLKTNGDRLVEVSVLGEVTPPTCARIPYDITPCGKPTILPGTGGIVYNVRVGDSATRWVADHLEPGVSIRHEKDEGPFHPNAGLNLLACVGNEARVVSGKADGARGTVTGKHGGMHIIADFVPEALEKMCIGDKIQIRACGLGLQLLEYPEVALFNMSPRLLESMDLHEEGDALVVPVASLVPAHVMGSGIGTNNVVYDGDYDINLFDEATVREYGLKDLRLGDLVAISDADHSYGRIYRRGALAIGVVIHGDCAGAGHGPGVTTLMSCSTGRLRYSMDRGANIARLLGLRDDV